MDGGCRCGKTRVRVSEQPMLATACHCTGCQTMSASAFSLTLILPAQGLQVLQGETVIGGLHGKDAHHMFCPHCMTWMFTRPEGLPVVNVRPSILDDHAWFAPYSETYTSEKLPWASTGAVVSFAKFPPMEKYAELIRDYRVWVESL